MSLPKWRIVRYVSDGMYSYQCLSCYSLYGGGCEAVDYLHCPWCGIKWEGQHICREQGEKQYKWPYREQKGYHLYFELQERTYWKEPWECEEEQEPERWQWCRYCGTTARALAMDGTGASGFKKMMETIRALVQGEAESTDPMFGKEYRLVLKREPLEWRVRADGNIVKVVKYWLRPNTNFGQTGD